MGMNAAFKKSPPCGSISVREREFRGVCKRAIRQPRPDSLRSSGHPSQEGNLFVRKKNTAQHIPFCVVHVCEGEGKQKECVRCTSEHTPTAKAVTPLKRGIIETRTRA